MQNLMALQTSSVSQAFLRKLIGFYKPNSFTATSTQFDMGYEQAKADLRRIILSEIPDVREHENFSAEQVRVLDAHPQESNKQWRRDTVGRWWWK